MGISKRILIEGIGGIGGFLSASLISSGYDISMVTNNEEITQGINSHGITIQFENHKFTVDKAKAVTKLGDAGGKFDIIFLVMKATGVKEAIKKSLHLLSESGYFVAMQNGIVEDEIIEVIDLDKVIPATVGWGGTMHSPGIYEKTSQGAIHIGEYDGKITERIEELQEILSQASPTIISENIRGVQWSKLAINSCITTLGAITGKKLGVMMSSKKIREVFLNIYQEVVDTAHYSGHELEAIASNPYLLYRKKGASWLNSWFRHQMLKLVGRKYSNLKSSMLQSIERGRKTEIDFLNGYVQKQGERIGVDTPYNQRCTELVKKLEAGKLESKLENVDLFNDL